MSEHPEHRFGRVIPPGAWTPAPRGLAGWKLRHRCRKNGGHWWHLIPGALIDWFCCQCGTATEGLPKDGNRR